MREKKVIHISFIAPETTTDASTKKIIEENIPTNGMLKKILLHFPDGCNGLVKIRCLLNGNQILPNIGFIALNNSTNEFIVNNSVVQSSKIEAVISNTDTVNSHSPSIVWSIEKDDY